LKFQTVAVGALQARAAVEAARVELVGQSADQP